MSDLVDYREAIVSFIDILGFKEFVKSRTAAEINEISSLFHFLYSEQRSFTGIKREREIISFSDSVVRILYVDDSIDNSWANPETDEIMSLALIQSRLLEKGIFVRGGIARGNIFFNKDTNVLFGPALIESYTLESEFSLDPRIVISEKVVGGYRADMFSNYNYIKRDEHSMFWINYFWGPISDAMSKLTILTDFNRHTEENKPRDNAEMILVHVVTDLNKELEKFLRFGEILYTALKSSNNMRVNSKYKWCISQYQNIIIKIHEWIDEVELSTYIDDEILNKITKASKHIMLLRP